MKGKLEEFDKEKGLFKSIYCGDCRQRKVCGKLDQSFCFLCQYQIELEKAKRYSNYQQVFRRKEQEQKERFWQLQLLKNCQCLEVEVQEIYLLFVNSLKRYQKKLKECQCETSTKVRVDYLDSAGSGWTYCEKCEARIESAGHHGVIKNRNSPSFWGLNIKERILCGNCLANLAKKMPSIRRAEFNRYRKVGRL